MRMRYLPSLLLILPFALSSCSDDEPEPEPEAPIEAPAPAPPEQAKGREKGKGARGGGLAEEFLTKYDADGDSAISDYEVDEQTWLFIARADANKDAKVTQEEFANLRPPRGEGGDGKGKGGGPGGKGGRGRPDPTEMIARMDQNGDGMISKDEAPEFIWERMSAADTNGDGAVSVEEMKTRRAAREAERANEGL